MDNPEERGPYFEGDILTPPNEITIKSGLIGEQYRWPEAIVAYEIHSDFGISQVN